MSYPKTKEEFSQMVQEIKSSFPAYKDPLCFAIGNPVRTGSGVLATVRYPVTNGPGQNTGAGALLMHLLGITPLMVQTAQITDEIVEEFLACCSPFLNDGGYHPNIEVMKLAKNFSATFIFDDIQPQGVEDSTLKLYALSHRHFKPGQLNLNGVFRPLPNVAWIGDTPMDIVDIDNALMKSMLSGDFAPDRIDKFPLYAHRINGPKMGVRIGDSSKVRLGAYLGDGTTVMAGAGFVNFNAGTEGPSMVEGRISSSAFIGAGTDVGGGASILGTLSGGNNVPISVGRNCLLEVNCALGIPTGDAVIIAQETGVMASSLVLVDLEGHPLHGLQVKAKELVGINAVTFRRSDRSGMLEVVRTPRNEEFARKLADGETILSADLHKNN